jgi:hypothetical protein
MRTEANESNMINAVMFETVGEDRAAVLRMDDQGVMVLGERYALVAGPDGWDVRDLETGELLVEGAEYVAEVLVPILDRERGWR